MNNTIMLAPLRPLISVRTWNLLVRNGYTCIADVWIAQRTGALRDVRNLGPVGLLEIRLALDHLPQEEESQSAHRGATPDYSLREAVQDMQSACALYLKTGDLDQFRHALKTFQLAEMLEDTSDAAPEPAEPIQNQPVQHPEPVTPGEPWFQRFAELPHPADDEDFAGYDMTGPS